MNGEILAVIHATKDIKNVNGSKALWAILNERGNERLKMNLANALETLIENHGSELVFAG